MIKTFVGNIHAYNHMKNYAKLKHPGPLILSGKKGLGKMKAAFSLAAFFMNCPESELLKSKDFLLIDKGNDTVKVEDILALIEQSSIAALGNVKVYLICHAEKMNVQAQNKLLKLIEDCNRSNIVIFICEQDLLLDTIKSRCLKIDFYPLTDNEMGEYLNSYKVEDQDFIRWLCDNCPYRLADALKVYPELKDTYVKILSLKSREDLLSILHMVNEKDSSEFFSLHSEHYFMALQMFLYLFYQLLILQINSVDNMKEHNLYGLYSITEAHRICMAITSHQRQWLSGSYTKNDFFDLVRTMI